MDSTTGRLRIGEVTRETQETNISVRVNLDSPAEIEISTGVGFFDHMLHQLAFHGRIGLTVQCEGDLHIDDHHTVEDVGIAIGQAVRSALGSTAVERYASLHAVMDESLSLIALDISGRGMLTWDCDFRREKIGDLSTECIREFFRAFAQSSGISLHIRRVTSDNDHHLAESIFKGVGITLGRATRTVERSGVSSTKGVI
ncbi:imidazoleglycerol-phosphate dehydratase [Armatimonadetes bacterium Uphvl-Ar1]|nr:imidazoleglycerol-phosphate dehydratase [Armatimonadetes bacterium Uphvl-Ar1]